MIVHADRIEYDYPEERQPDNLLHAIYRQYARASGRRKDAYATGDVDDPGFIDWLNVVCGRRYRGYRIPAPVETPIEKLEEILRYLVYSGGS